MIDRKSLVVAIGIITLACVLPASASDAKMTAEELLARHLESIGTAEARGAVKTRVAQGTSRYTIFTGGAGKLDGKAFLISEAIKMHMGLQYPDPKYIGEEFVTDGNSAEAYGFPQRTAFAQFMRDQGVILRNGLLGGVLSTAWPFLHPGAHEAKLSYGGRKKIDGRELHELRYMPKKGSGDADIRLYFEPETYSHVLTTYTVSITPELGRNQILGRDSRGNIVEEGAETRTARQQTIRYRAEERFGEFRQVDSLKLPASWNIRFSIDGYKSASMAWEMIFTRIENNVSFDPKNFAFK